MNDYSPKTSEKAPDRNDGLVRDIDQILYGPRPEVAATDPLMPPKTKLPLPTVGADAGPQEIFAALATRLDTVAKVIEGEFNWLKPQVDYSRKVDDGSIAYQLEHGLISEAEAAVKRVEDDLVLRRTQVDRHLSNLNSATKIIADAAGLLQFFAEPVAVSRPEAKLAGDGEPA